MRYAETCGMCQSSFTIECHIATTLEKTRDSWRNNHKCMTAPKALAQSFIAEHDRELAIVRTTPLPDDEVGFLSGSKFASRRILRVIEKQTR